MICFSFFVDGFDSVDSHAYISICLIDCISYLVLFCFLVSWVLLSLVAVWPGWGHASENPRLPRSLKERGIQFIGPTAPVMAALGDKVSANILAQTAKVPSIPWSGQGIECELNEEVSSAPTRHFSSSSSI